MNTPIDTAKITGFSKVPVQQYNLQITQGDEQVTLTDVLYTETENLHGCEAGIKVYPVQAQIFILSTLSPEQQTAFVVHLLDHLNKERKEAKYPSVHFCTMACIGANSES